MPQLEVGKKIFETDENILVIAPTGTGKTAIGELAIVKELSRRSASEGPSAVILVPLKAITSERIRVWEQREGTKVVVATAETEVGLDEILASDVVISVPEKIDSITRAHRDNVKVKQFLKSVRVLIVDEVHLLDMDGRGDALEVVITRFLDKSEIETNKRVVALSATVPNFEDVASWLCIPSSCVFRYGNEIRPIKLETKVVTYTETDSIEQDRNRREQLVLEQIETGLKHSYQVIVFVSSRRNSETLAKKIVGFWDKEEIHSNFVSGETLLAAKSVKLNLLSQIVFAGVGFHHAGLSKTDRGMVEEAFREGHIHVLCATTTLAWGVNLPADLVIVQDIELYDPLKGQMLLSAIDLQQMLGRAGRPGFSKGIGQGIVISPIRKQLLVRTLIVGESVIKSRLLASLKEHLLAEIVRGAVLGRKQAISWLKRTYYYTRLKKTASNSLSSLQEILNHTLEYLSSADFISRKEGVFKPSQFGELTIRFYSSLRTAEKFRNYLLNYKSLSSVFLAFILASAEEFEGVLVRKEETPLVEEFEALFPQKNREELPRLNLGQMKVACMVLSLSFGLTSTLDDQAIRSTILRLVYFLKELSELLFGTTLMPILEFVDSLKRKPIHEIEGIASWLNLSVRVDWKEFPETIKAGDSCFGKIILKKMLPLPKAVAGRILVNNNLAFEGLLTFPDGQCVFPLSLQTLPTDSQIVCLVELRDSETNEIIQIAEKSLNVAE